jgi:hypothetical protein
MGSDLGPRNQKQLLAELLHIAEETKEFDPPYVPSRYLQDMANSDPAELVYKYVLAKDMTDGVAAASLRLTSSSPSPTLIAALLNRPGTRRSLRRGHASAPTRRSVGVGERSSAGASSPGSRWV